MKMARLGVLLSTLLALTSAAAHIASVKPALPAYSNGTSSYESASATTPLATPRSPTAPAAPETTVVNVPHTPVTRTAPVPTVRTTTTHLPPPGAVEEGLQEYYSSYDYADNNSREGVFPKEPGVIPDPGAQDVSEDIVHEQEVDVALPDDSLADTDLHDHDLIDSVMYIYFGASPPSDGGAGRQVLIVGAAISLMAQFFALASAARRLSARRDTASVILLCTELSLTASNLVFMLGVQATGKRWWCEIVALLLHYLHLVACCWLFFITFLVYRRLRTEQRLGLRWCCSLTWVLPAVLVLACFTLNPRGYETRRYCWMSVQRGMLLSYMAPVATLIIVNTVLAVFCQRLLSRYDVTKQCGLDGEDVVLRRALRSAVMLLPVFAVSWFLRVLALENSESILCPVLAALTDAFLNWFIFLRSHVLLPSCESPDQVAQTRTECDAQPLLTPEMSPIHVISHSGGELLELRLDTISMIST